jgi:hypothetical protein
VIGNLQRFLDKCIEENTTSLDVRTETIKNKEISGLSAFLK